MLKTDDQLAFPKIAGSDLDSSRVSSGFLEQLTGFDDAALRRIERLTDPAGKPWLPRPHRGRWQLRETVLGLCRYLQARSEEKEDHPIYPSQELAESRGLIPRELIKYARGKGIDYSDTGGRIKSEPLRKFGAELLKKILGSEGGLQNLDGFEELDLNLQRARVAKEDADERARNNALAKQLVHRQEDIDELIWENCLQPLRAHIDALVRRCDKLVRDKKQFDPADLKAEIADMLKRIRLKNQAPSA